jgi:hypothetical protein
MIARIWHGWTARGNADVYETLLRTQILPGIERVPGYCGAWLLRRDRSLDVEFVTLTLFESLGAVRRFAGDDYEAAVVPPEAQALLERFDVRSVHYDVALTPADGESAPDTAPSARGWRDPSA